MIKMVKNFINENKVKKAIKILKEKNGIVILPTETVYGIFAIANPDNLKRVNELKGSELDKKLTVMFPSREEASKYIQASKYQKSIIDSELPGTKTIIIETNKDTISSLLPNAKTIGIRIPAPHNNKFLIKVLKATGPLFATSVNSNGEEPLNDFELIKTKFGDKVDYVAKHKIDNPTPSSIIDVTNNEIKLIRRGK